MTSASQARAEAAPPLVPTSERCLTSLSTTLLLLVCITNCLHCNLRSLVRIGLHLRRALFTGITPLYLRLKADCLIPYGQYFCFLWLMWSSSPVQDRKGGAIAPIHDGVAYIPAMRLSAKPPVLPSSNREWLQAGLSRSPQVPSPTHPFCLMLEARPDDKDALKLHNSRTSDPCRTGNEHTLQTVP